MLSRQTGLLLIGLAGLTLPTTLPTSGHEKETHSAGKLPDPNRAALVLIEFQNEWLAEEGTLRFLMEDRPQFESAVAAGRQALAVARRAGIPVVHVGLTFEPGYPELRPGRHGLRAAIPKFGTWRAGSSGAAFHPDFTPRSNEIVISGRNGASGFAGSNLDERLRDQGIETIYLAGFALHVCVESTLRDAHDRGYETILLADAAAAFTAEQREHVLEHVVHHFGEAIDNPTFQTRARAYITERRADASGKQAATE